ncbi:MAG: DUF4386 domain-containing protein [Acidobacteria bacterium]|nr:DUF4386 domain-containing protein [Acidobacteriota bacterium]MBI3655303.1 DUF4386 domain-containing protein [Acidobacteriota bacterium]
MNSTKKTARVAGLLYVLAGLPAPFVLLYIPGKLIVPGNATATAHNILASESLFRIGIAGELINAAFFLFVPLALYRLLKGVNKGQASLMVTLFAVSVPISFMNVLNSIAALMLVRGADFLSVFDQPQREALALLFLRMHSQGFVAAQIFWGLWLFPFGLLVYKSGFLPRILGVLLMINCFAYLADSFTSLLWPTYVHAVSQVTLAPKFGELAIILWLLIKGAKDQPLAAAA